jgi:Ca2+-binding EF-hand superfamily protein
LSHDRIPALALAAALLAGAPAALAQAAPDMSNALERIMQADANNDGQVTKAEFLAYRAQQFSRLDRNGDGFITMDDVPRLMASRFQPRLQMLQQQFDANHDGKVSRDEFVNGPTRGFDMADANHDGVVTRDEVRTALARVKAPRAADYPGRRTPPCPLSSIIPGLC